MELKEAEFAEKLGLNSKVLTAAKKSPQILASAEKDPLTKMTAGIKSELSYDPKTKKYSYEMIYWRHLPFGQSKRQKIVSITTSPVSDRGTVRIDDFFIQARNETPLRIKIPENVDFEGATSNRHRRVVEEVKKTRRLLNGIESINTHLAKNGSVAMAAKLLHDAQWPEVLGEDIVMRGLDPAGGFNLPYSDRFTQQAAGRVERTDTDIEMLKTSLGFRYNCQKKDNEHLRKKSKAKTNAKSGIDYSVDIKPVERKNGDFEVSMDVISDGVPGQKTHDTKDFIKLKYTKTNNGFLLSEARFMGMVLDPSNVDQMLALEGVIHGCNSDLADDDYPDFLSNLLKFDLLDLVSEIPAPDDNAAEMQLAIFHGIGFEQLVEKYGASIGIGEAFLNRKRNRDGTIDMVATGVDLPIEIGGNDSDYDLAIPHNKEIHDAVDTYVITHAQHFDHGGATQFLARMKELKGKTLLVTLQDEKYLNDKMTQMKVPPQDRPIFKAMEGQGAHCIRDKNGRARFWVLYDAYGTEHSAPCTPFVIIGCDGDNKYLDSYAVYGDGVGLTDQATEFLQSGWSKLLAEQEGVTASKVKNKKIDAILHDPTGIMSDGFAPEESEVADNLDVVFSLFPDKGMAPVPYSTNIREYKAILDVSARQARNLTSVGQNATNRMSMMNGFGVIPNFDISEEAIEPEDIPDEVLEDTFAVFHKILSDLYQTEELKMPKEYPEEMEDLPFWDRKLSPIKAHVQRVKKELGEDLESKGLKVDNSVAYQILSSYLKHGEFRVNNDLNGYLLRRAVMDGKTQTPYHAGRSSGKAKDQRQDPGKHTIILTGPTGTSNEHFATLQKASNFISLLDFDEKSRPSGYQVDFKNDYIPVITQTASVPGTTFAQSNMVRDMVCKRGMTVVCSFSNGFTIVNPREDKNRLMRELREKGWKPEEIDGDIFVYSKPIHFHGHGFKENFKKVAKAFPWTLHLFHHIPSRKHLAEGIRALKEMNLRYSDLEPANFQLSKLQPRTKTRKEQKLVGYVSPAYFLLRMNLPYGIFHDNIATVDFAKAVRDMGDNATDFMNVRRGDKEGLYKQKVVEIDQMDLTDRNRTYEYLARLMGMSPVDTRPADVSPRSRVRDHYVQKPKEPENG